LKEKKQNNQEISNCPHKNVLRDGGFLVCQDCGEVFDEDVTFDKNISVPDYYNDTQRAYEKNIRIKDSIAKRDPVIKQKYDKIQVLDKWYRDYNTSFTEQKKTIELLKSYEINIDKTNYQAIKKRYLKFNRKHRKSYQNMVIIFLAIVWMEIKETTNIRIEKYIKVCKELGHKLNKKMLNNAMLKVKNTELTWKKIKNLGEIEKEIKEKIKILFQKDLNNIPYDEVKEYIPDKSDYEKLKIEMQLLVDGYLEKISHENLKNLNYKAFTAGLIYYIGQTLPNRKIFTQILIEKATSFSSTTIRKKYHFLKDLLGDPKVK